MRCIKILAYLWLIPFITLLAQKKVTSNLEIGSYGGSSQQLPFWLKSNKFGSVPETSSTIFTGFNSSSTPQTYRKDTLNGRKKKILDWNYGFESVLSVGATNNVSLIESYLSGRVGFVTLSIGRKKEIFGLVDTLLSSGSMAWSGNARPIPKVQLSTNGFVYVPFTNKLIAFQSSYAHGWLGELRVNPITREEEDNRFNNYRNYLTTYLHQKSFFLRLGKPTWKIKLIGGFVHIAQYGNERILMPGAYSMLTDKELYQKVVFGESWAQSKVGNHLGSIDVQIDIKHKSLDFSLYRQNYFENGSLLNALNRDGLTGITIINRNFNKNRNFQLKRAVIEHLYTNDQVDPLVPTSGSRNDYYNHDLYYDGWTYLGNLIGTPLATIDRNLRENTGNKEFKGGYIANNRIQALHIAITGTSQKSIDYTFKFSYSYNQGTYFFPFESSRTQISTYVELQKSLRKVSNCIIKCSLGADVGSLYKSNVGAYFGINKQWH